MPLARRSWPRLHPKTDTHSRYSCITLSPVPWYQLCPRFTTISHQTPCAVSFNTSVIEPLQRFPEAEAPFCLTNAASQLRVRHVLVFVSSGLAAQAKERSGAPSLVHRQVIF